MVEPGYGEGRKWWRQGYEAGRNEVLLDALELNTERNRLRKILEDAPHADSCSLENSTSPNPPACDCWKAGL